jgi:hypothetical protein
MCAAEKRCWPGDRVAYYSPTLAMGGKDKFQRFVSIGVVQAGEPYAFDMGGGFVPFRRDVAYVAAREASILPCSMTSSLWKTASAGATNSVFGLFEISDHDMRLIARAMRADGAMLGFDASARPLKPGARNPWAARWCA